MSEDIIANLILALVVLLFPPAAFCYAKWVLSMRIEELPLQEPIPCGENPEENVLPAFKRSTK